jgi:hypothetical protein
MGVHLAAKGFDVKCFAHPTSISPEPYAIRTLKSCPSDPELAEGEEPLYFAFAFAVVLAFASL